MNIIFCLTLTWILEAVFQNNIHEKGVSLIFRESEATKKNLGASPQTIAEATSC